MPITQWKSNDRQSRRTSEKILPEEIVATESAIERVSQERFLPQDAVAAVAMESDGMIVTKAEAILFEDLSRDQKWKSTVEMLMDEDNDFLQFVATSPENGSLGHRIIARHLLRQRQAGK